MATTMEISAQPLINGHASGRLLVSDIALSFWGGTNLVTGEVTDSHHPLCGSQLSGSILAIPCGKGSCTGSVAMLELLLNGTSPSALIFCLPEQILTVGVMVAKTLFGKSIPVLMVSQAEFTSLHSYEYASIDGGRLMLGHHELSEITASLIPTEITAPHLDLSEQDKFILNGHQGKAAQAAMEILVDFATLQNANRLVPVTQAHIDTCGYNGPATLKFAEHFLATGDAKVAVPTTMNAISIDKRRWRELKTDPFWAEESEKLADAYTAMGAEPTFTCAPYLLDSAPFKGEHVGWGESNAVVFANSVLGAQTQKYPDFIDVCIALTGRAPLAGCHIPESRLPTITIDFHPPAKHDESMYPLLGYHIGQLSGHHIPLILGLQHSCPTTADLKAFGAAFATTSSAPMFHIAGITPEALTPDLPSTSITHHVSTPDLLRTWQILNTASTCTVDLIALGNPHFSFEEFASLARLCIGHRRHSRVRFVVTTSRDVYDRVLAQSWAEGLSEFGVTVVTDTCWCMLRDPVAVCAGKNVMTNSGKYAHYAPALVGCWVHFGSLEECVDAACTGMRLYRVGHWLRGG